MLLRHTEMLDCISLEIEFDQHGWFVSDDTAIVSRFDGNDLGSDEIALAAILEFDLDVTVGEKAHVSVHAALSSGTRLHVLGPVKARWVDDALHASAANAGHIHLNSAEV